MLHGPRLRVLAMAVLAHAGALPAGAQAVYGSVAGTVRDPTGAPLAGVTVTVTSVERSGAHSVTTDESGFFVREHLLPGAHEVKAEIAGYRTAIVPAVRV